MQEFSRRLLGISQLDPAKLVSRLRAETATREGSASSRFRTDAMANPKAECGCGRGGPSAGADVAGNARPDAAEEVLRSAHAGLSLGGLRGLAYTFVRQAGKVVEGRPSVDAALLCVRSARVDIPGRPFLGTLSVP